ncbi:MAG: flagellar protein FlgN [Clostridia bacterium]|nr:flagellar protein FlgN [Clostridia bacterium]
MEVKDSRNYIEILIESLLRKKEILNQIMKLNDTQSELISQNEVTGDSFTDTISKKQKLIENLNLLDSGFEKVYQRVRMELLDNRELYKEQITLMQELISQITDYSVKIQTDEERNRRSIEESFDTVKQDIRQSRTSVKAASDYYKNMSKVNYIDPQFMDKKK